MPRLYSIAEILTGIPHTIGLGQGVLDEWSMGNHHSGYTLHARSMGDGVGEAFP